MSCCNDCKSRVAFDLKGKCPYWNDSDIPLPEGYTCSWSSIEAREAVKQYERACNMPQEEKDAIRQLVKLFAIANP